MIGSLFLLAAACLPGLHQMADGYAQAPFLPGPPVKRTRWRMPTKAPRADPDKKRRRKARQAAQRRNRRAR